MTVPTTNHAMASTTFGGPTTLPRRFRPFQAVLRHIEFGSIDVELPDGSRLSAEGQEPGPHGRIVILNRNFFRRLLGEGHLGFGEMYVDGWWTTPDLQALMDVILLNNESMANQFNGTAIFRLWERLRHVLNGNSRRGAPRNIARHYDLGNNFYGLWLDGTMTYSSALFRRGNETLEEAQRNKYAAVCDRLALNPGDRVLEIGCGWGGFAEYAIQERGLKVTALTISRAQHEYARKRLFDAGLGERGDILLRDYRDERGSYDGVASIEMIEAVGEQYWPIYFTALHDRIRPGGTVALQAITIADRLFPTYRNSADFVQKHIFPGGMLPSQAVLDRLSSASGLQTLGTEAFGKSYSKTLRTWRGRFNGQREQISKLGFDERFHRTWDFYLASCAAVFAAGVTDVMHFTYRRRG